MDESAAFSPFAQYLVSGIAFGSIYAMVAIGFNIIYNATGIINFAQGEFVMLGGMLMVFAVDNLHLPLSAAILFAVVVVCAIGVLFERIAIRPIKHPTVLALIIITLAGSFILKGAAMLIWGKDVYSLPQFFGDKSIWLFGAAIKTQDIMVWGSLGTVSLLLALFFGRSVTGKAMRACSYNRVAASLVGIKSESMVMLAFGLSAAIGALAGAVIVPITAVEYDAGAMLGLKGFCAAVLGGLGNSAAAVVAGLLLGILESLSAGYISSHYKDAIALSALLLVLFVRPRGLFGRADVARFQEF
jgi:branched-chain amino acid transport system permease protein